MILPIDVTMSAVDCVRRLHLEELAQFERDRGLKARSVESFQSVVPMSGEGVFLAQDTPPAFGVVTVGLQDGPDRQEDDTLDLTWLVGCEVLAVGKDVEKTLRARDALTMTVTQLLLTRWAGGLVREVDLVDMGLGDGVSDRGSLVGQARFTLAVTTQAALTMDPVLPVLDDDRLPRDTPGARPADPYTPPVAWPQVSSIEIDPIPSQGDPHEE